MNQPYFVLDSFALLAFFRAETAGARVRELLEQAQAGEIALSITTVNLGEVFYRAIRERGLEQAHEMLGRVEEFSIEIADVDLELALLGTSVSRSTVQALGRFRRVYLALDSDEAGQCAAAQLGAKLKEHKIGLLRTKDDLVQLLAQKQASLKQAQHLADQLKKIPPSGGLHDLTVVELQEMAKAKGVSLNMTKQDVIGQSLRTSLTWGIALGLFAGKSLGIAIFAWIAVRFRIAVLPDDVTWPQVLGVGMLAGVGFTVALFVNELAFDSTVLIQRGKIGILLGSFASGVLGYIFLRMVTTDKRQCE